MNAQNKTPVADQRGVPDGFVAVPGWDCANCAFDNDARCLMSAPTCGGDYRDDGIDVVFIDVVFAKATSKPATLLHPMGSMGEEVPA